MSALQFENISKQFKHKEALKNVSFALEYGDFTAILGANGAGKSTIFNLISALDVPTKGKIFVDGLPLGKSSKINQNIRKKIGLVFQEPSLDLDLTVLQNMRYFAGLFSVKDFDKKIKKLLNDFELSDRENETVRNMNGGHKRRLELARALLSEPKILVLDEPTVGLDPISANFITERAHNLAKDGVCVVWITHLLDEIESDDEVIFLDNGKIIKTGSYESLGGAKTLFSDYREKERPSL